jgi:hypothetical protein
LNLGAHDLSMWAEDTDGKTNFDRVSITVEDSPPTAEILTPEEGSDAVYYTGEFIALSGLAGDAEDAPSDLLAEWSSSLDGTLDVDASVDSSGTIASYATLTEGDHVLSLTVTDSAGQTATDTVVIAVGAENQQPECAITAPADGSVSTFGETLDFTANATDPDVPSDWLTASLSSDKDGDLATITPTSGLVSFSTDALIADSHTITLTVEDELGLSCTDSIIVAVSTPPTIAVSAPDAGATFNQGEPVTFEASAADAEDGAAALSVNWTSSLDGPLLEAAPDSAGTSTFISSDLSQGTHTLTVTVTDGDGLFASVVQSLVVNGGPTAPVVGITPETPQTNDGLAATMVTPSTDPEGDALTYTYAWARDGVDMGEPSSTVDAASTAKGQTWTVTVAAFDGGLAGPAGSASVEILNTVPTVESATLSPAAPSAHDTLVCTPGATADADGDDVSFSYAWTVNSTVTAETSSSYSSELAVYDTISCTVTPFDDEADGTPVESDTVEVTNTPPSIASVSINPDPAFVTDTLSCSYTGFHDAEGDADASTIAWTIDGTPAGTGEILATGFTRGNVVVCTVTPSDGITTGDPVSGSRTVANTPPTAPSVSISPTEPAVDVDDIVCGIDLESSDADGDGVSYTITWTVDGAPYTDAITTIRTGDTISADEINDDEEWTCTVTPHDGEDAGPAGTATVIPEGFCHNYGDGSDGDFFADGPTTLASGVYNFTTFEITADAVVTVTGSVPLVIYATESIVIAGDVDAYGKSASGSTGGAGVAGGGDGLDGVAGGGPGSHGANGETYTDHLLCSFTEPTELIGGGRGGPGRNHGSMFTGPFAGGSGGGGGAIGLFASSVDISGALDIHGGSGATRTHWGGSGASGTIWIGACELIITGTFIRTGSLTTYEDMRFDAYTVDVLYDDYEYCPPSDMP